MAFLPMSCHAGLFLLTITSRPFTLRYQLSPLDMADLQKQIKQ
jgi:hypothetical protein